MSCAICGDQMYKAESVQMWGPEFAHTHCVIAYTKGLETGAHYEREACAKVCEDIAMEYRRNHDSSSENVADECYERILARPN